MNKKFAVTAVIFGTLALGACGTKTVYVNSPAPVPVVTAAISTSQYVTDVQTAYPMALNVDSATIIRTGNSVCGALARGASVTDLITAGDAATPGYPGMSQAVVDAARNDLCPGS